MPLRFRFMDVGKVRAKGGRLRYWVTWMAMTGMLLGSASSCSDVADKDQEAIETPTPVKTLTPIKTAEPTVTATVTPTATVEVLPPAIAMPAQADLAAAGVDATEFNALRLVFEDWWLFWTELGAVSIVDMPPATPEAGVSASAVYRIFVDAVTGKKMVGVEVLGGNYAGQTLVLPIDHQDGEATGRPAAAEVDTPEEKNEWYPLFLSGDIGYYADHWVRFGENNRVIAYVDPVSGAWVEGPLAEALNFYGYDTMPATEAEALAGCPLAPDPINDTQNFLAWRERYRATIADSLLPINIVAGGGHGQYDDEYEVIMPEGFSYGCYRFDHEGQGYVMVTIRYPEGLMGYIFDDFLVDRNDPIFSADQVLEALSGGGRVRLIKVTDILHYYKNEWVDGDTTVALALTEAVPDIHVLMARSLEE